jgi:hypothetical protein
MIRSSDVADFEALCVKFLEANTPWYLYRHFRVSDGPKQLAERYTAQQLVDEIDSQMAAEGRDLNNVVVAYACAVALTRRPLAEASAALEHGPAKSPPWFQEIIEMYRATSIATNSLPLINFEARPQPMVLTALRAANETAKAEAIPTEPKIIVPAMLSAANYSSKDRS